MTIKQLQNLNLNSSFSIFPFVIRQSQPLGFVCIIIVICLLLLTFYISFLCVWCQFISQWSGIISFLCKCLTEQEPGESAVTFRGSNHIITCKKMQIPIHIQSTFILNNFHFVCLHIGFFSTKRLLPVLFKFKLFIYKASSCHRN